MSRKNQSHSEYARADGEIELRESKIYDTHVESLVRVLSFRDLETEEHTRRVTALTLSFACLWDLSKKDLIHIQRGALLHDIGKVGIPDSILRKNGPLTDDERAMVQMHPVYAYELLHPVFYLRPALDIPYCHHEKWDGTGYPQRLKGYQIPLAARLFAIIDVWDALLSDRPYRPAWSKEQTITYIQNQSGKHFDPHVVRIFGKFLAGIGECKDADPSLPIDVLLFTRQDSTIDSFRG